MRFILSFLAALLVICGAQPDPSREGQLRIARRSFTANLMRFLDERANQKNILVSTFGLHSALSAVLAGAKGNTYKQLWNTLGFNYTTLDKQSMLDVYQETFENVTKLRTSGLDFATLFAVDEQLELENEFKNEITHNFRAGLMKENFRTKSAKATADINGWVSNITKGKIAKLFDQDLSSDTKAVLANALHFKSNWRSQFDERLNFVSKFYLKSGGTKNVTYMTIPAHSLKGARWSRNYGFQNVEIPFDNEGKLWFGIMLADLGGPNLDCCTSFVDFIHGTHPTQVDLTIPKFNVSQSHSDLKEVLQSLGITDLFDQNTADLSGIDGKKDLFVSNIVQKSKVSIDEKGAEGASATGISFEATSAVIHTEKPIQFVVNSPFIFTISDRVNGVDFFTGIIYEP